MEPAPGAVPPVACLAACPLANLLAPLVSRAAVSAAPLTAAAATAPVVAAATAVLLLADEDEVTAGRLADLFGVRPSKFEGLRERLARFRASHLKGWTEILNKRKAEPSFRYALGAVRALIVEWLDEPEESPAEKAPAPTTTG